MSPSAADAANASSFPPPGCDANATLGGTPVDWASCFGSEASRRSACPSFVWWSRAEAWGSGAFGSASLLSDPPHEAQGWYSVYDTDVSTLATIRRAAARVAAASGCAASALLSVRAAAVSQAAAAVGRFGSAACIADLGPPPVPRNNDTTL